MRTNSDGGVGLSGLVFVVFLTLKLCDKIDWSWWWVTCPLWGPLALLSIGVALILAVKLILFPIISIRRLLDKKTVSSRLVRRRGWSND